MDKVQVILMITAVANSIAFLVWMIIYYWKMFLTLLVITGIGLFFAWLASMGVI